MRNDPIFRHVGPRAVTERLLRKTSAAGGPSTRSGNPLQGVDGQGDVTKSEVVVWGRAPAKRALRPAPSRRLRALHTHKAGTAASDRRAQGACRNPGVAPAA